MSTLILALISIIQVVATPSVQPESLVDEVSRFESAQTNQARFDVLTAMLRARNVTFDVQPFTIEKPLGREDRTEGRNVIVSLGEGPDEIVVGAHFDAVRLQDGSLSRGAVDNAASSVILVRLAENLRAEKLAARVKVVWFDMEELGLIGSQRYVEAGLSPRVVAMLNFDINAYGDTIVFGPSAREDNLALRRSLVQTCAEEDIGCIRFPQMPPGDDRSFVNAGIPTLSIGMLPAVEVHQLWLLMNGGANSGLAQGTTPEILRTIHTPADSSAKVNGEAMARVLRFAQSLVRKVSRR